MNFRMRVRPAGRLYTLWMCHRQNLGQPEGICELWVFWSYFLNCVLIFFLLLLCTEDFLVQCMSSNMFLHILWDYFIYFKIILQLIFPIFQPPSSVSLSFYQKYGMLPSGTWSPWHCFLIWDMIECQCQSFYKSAQLQFYLFCHLTSGICWKLHKWKWMRHLHSNLSKSWIHKTMTTAA